MAHLLKAPTMGYMAPKISPIKRSAGITMTSGVIRKTTSDLSEKVTRIKIKLIEDL